MSKHHYFVVYGEELENGTVRFTVDNTTCDARFPEGTIWDTDTEEWSSPQPINNGWENDAFIYEKLLRRVNPE